MKRDHFRYHDLLHPTVPFVRGSETSKSAAEVIGESVASMRERVYVFMLSRGDEGTIDDEIEVALGMKHQTASARRRDLETAGRVRKTDRKRKTRSRCDAAVYVVVRQ